MADERTRRANAQVILDTIAARGGDGRVLHAIAARESALNHAIRHELPADREGSIKSWKRNAERYASNPYYADEKLWDHGKGLFAMMPSNHLFRWDPKAHPDVLFNPYVASVVASRLARACMQRGAQTWSDVNQCWATGSPERTASWDARRERLIARLRKMGYPAELADAVPRPGDWGMGPQPDQMQAIWALAGEQPSVVSDDHPRPDDRGRAMLVSQPAGSGSGAGEGGFGWVLVLGLLGAGALALRSK